jgi:hypothetical protein
LEFRWHRYLDLVELDDVLSDIAHGIVIHSGGICCPDAGDPRRNPALSWRIGLWLLVRCEIRNIIHIWKRM